MPTTASNVEATDILSQRSLPSWLASLLVHLSAIILLVLIQFKVVQSNHASNIEANFADSPAAGTLDIGTSDGGQNGQSMLVTEGPPILDRQQLNSALADGVQQPIEGNAKIDLPDLLSSGAGKGAPLLSGNGGLGTGPAAGAFGRSIGIGDGSKPGPGGRTSFFSIEAEGSKFVYVFDRSESMGYAFYSAESNNEFGGIPIRAAKAELLASLNELNSSQQFNVIFYNHQPMLFRPTISAPHMMFANSENKRAARYFVSEMQAAGGTHHVPALEEAIGMRPDVIFLLTDGEEKDDPTPADIKDLERLNAGHAAIFLIQFAEQPRPESSLVQLAQESRGKYQFIDVRRAGANVRKTLQNGWKKP